MASTNSSGKVPIANLMFIQSNSIMYLNFEAETKINFESLTFSWEQFISLFLSHVFSKHYDNEAKNHVDGKYRI